jgi:integrase
MSNPLFLQLHEAIRLRRSAIRTERIPTVGTVYRVSTVLCPPPRIRSGTLRDQRPASRLSGETTLRTLLARLLMSSHSALTAPRKPAPHSAIVPSQVGSLLRSVERISSAIAHIDTVQLYSTMSTSTSTEAQPVGGANTNSLPRYLSFHPLNRTYYYKNPGMARKANLGRDKAEAVRVVSTLNRLLAIEAERNAERLDAVIDFGAQKFGAAFEAFIEKCSNGYRLNSSTRRLLAQRRDRLASRIDDLQLPGISTRVLREAIQPDSPFERAKLRTLLERFVQFANSSGNYLQHIRNPADELFVDPPPGKLRRRMTLEQFRALFAQAADWLRHLMVLALQLALRRVDLVNLRFEDVVQDRIISRIRKTDTQARDIEATSVSFPILPDVHRVIVAARESSIRAHRCPPFTKSDHCRRISTRVRETRRAKYKTSWLTLTRT